jgi:2-isopropylmalate synthase
VRGGRVIAVGEGNGPVNALDKALRSALEQTFPELAVMSLTDFKVRILEGSQGTGAITRVLVESTSSSLETKGDSWNTVGVDENIVAASWHALEQAVTYCLLRSGREPEA